MQIDRRTKQGFCFYVGKNNFLFVLKNIEAKLHISHLSFCIFELRSKILPFVLKNIGAKLHISRLSFCIFELCSKILPFVLKNIEASFIFLTHLFVSLQWRVCLLFVCE